MKLRIRGNSIRVRLERNEVARLGRGERIEQVTEFSPDSHLVSRVESSPVSHVAATFYAGCMTLLLPAEMVKAWAASDDVSIEAVQKISEDRELSILVEKDFECLHSQKEENADAFPNPRGCPADHAA